MNQSTQSTRPLTEKEKKNLKKAGFWESDLWKYCQDNKWTIVGVTSGAAIGAAFASGALGISLALTGVGITGACILDLTFVGVGMVVGGVCGFTAGYNIDKVKAANESLLAKIEELEATIKKNNELVNKKLDQMLKEQAAERAALMTGMAKERAALMTGMEEAIDKAIIMETRKWMLRRFRR